MAWFIIGIIVAVAAVIVTLFTRIKAIAIIGIILGLVLSFFSMFYTQDVGEALVVKNADGTIAREDTTAGMDLKAPWQDTISFDIKGQQALFKTDGTSKDGEHVDGPTITVTGTDKVPVDVDVAITYSIDPSRVSEIYTVYKTEESLKEKLVNQVIKSVVKDAANGMSVDSLIADRATYSKKIDDALKARWNGQGLIVDAVNLQTVRPPQAILDRINASQASQQQLVQAQNDTKVKEEQAKQKSIEAKGVADANKILNDSLTDKVIQSQYIDALKNAKDLVVVPNGSSPMINVPASK